MYVCEGVEALRRSFSFIQVNDCLPLHVHVFFFFYIVLSISSSEILLSAFISESVHLVH
jgi:hypothetical protein